jgi:hypothetical protein
MATLNDPNAAANIMAVKAPSTAPVATDPAAVVTISPNSPALTVSGTVTANAGTNLNTSALATSANQSTLGNQTTKLNDGTNTAAVKAASTAPVATDPSLVVTISPNSQDRIVGNAGAAIDAAAGAATPANAIMNGWRAATANPTNATGGNLVFAMADKAGRAVVTPVQIRDLVAVQQVTITASAAETTIITAGGGGVFNDLIGLVITTTIAVANTITIRDATAGTTRAILDYPGAAVVPGVPAVLTFPVPVPQAVAANNWTAQCSSATGATHITALFAKNT